MSTKTDTITDEQPASQSAAICSLWVPLNLRAPDEVDAPHELVWWWVPRLGEPVADWWDLPNDATHWLPWNPEMMPPSAPKSDEPDVLFTGMHRKRMGCGNHEVTGNPITVRLESCSPFVVPPFRPRPPSAITYVWWSWHPLYPYWSKSCWGGATIEEAQEHLKKGRLACYHNKLICHDGITLAEVQDEPCREMDVWHKIKRQMDEANQKLTGESPVYRTLKL